MKETLKNQKGSYIMAEKVEKVVRITKAQRFEDIRALLSGEKVQHGTDITTALEFIDRELELLAKKNSGDTKKQAETRKVNNSIKEELLEFLGTLGADNPGMTCTEILKAKGWLGTYGVSKLAYIFRELRESGQVKSQVVKGKTLFSLA